MECIRRIYTFLSALCVCDCVGDRGGVGCRMSDYCRMDDDCMRMAVAGRLFDARACVAVHHHGARDAMRCDAWEGWMDTMDKCHGYHGRAWMRMAAHGVAWRRDRRRRRWRDGGFGVLPGARAWVRRDWGGRRARAVVRRGGARWCSYRVAQASRRRHRCVVATATHAE